MNVRTEHAWRGSTEMSRVLLFDIRCRTGIAKQGRLQVEWGQEYIRQFLRSCWGRLWKVRFCYRGATPKSQRKLRNDDCASSTSFCAALNSEPNSECFCNLLSHPSDVRVLGAQTKPDRAPSLRALTAEFGCLSSLASQLWPR